MILKAYLRFIFALIFTIDGEETDVNEGDSQKDDLQQMSLAGIKQEKLRICDMYSNR